MEGKIEHVEPKSSKLQPDIITYGPMGARVLVSFRGTLSPKTSVPLDVGCSSSASVPINSLFLQFNGKFLHCIFHVSINDANHNFM